MLGQFNVHDLFVLNLTCSVVERRGEALILVRSKLRKTEKQVALAPASSGLRPLNDCIEKNVTK